MHDIMHFWLLLTCNNFQVSYAGLNGVVVVTLISKSTIDLCIVDSFQSIEREC